MSNIITLTSGTSYASQANNLGIAIPCSYALPIYDHRYDPFILSANLVSPTTCEPVTAVDFYGEKFWNVTSFPSFTYTISSQRFLISAAGQTGTGTISGNPFNATANINLLNGKPMSPCISGSSVVYSGGTWTVANRDDLTGSELLREVTGYSNIRQVYHPVLSYSPIFSADGTGVGRGKITVRLNNQLGNFKFNKIVIFMSKFNNGVEDTSVPPVPVFVATTNRPYIKSSDGSNIDFVELDLEVSISASNYFGNVNYLSNSEWAKTGPSAISYIGFASLGTSAIPGSWDPKARFTVYSESSVDAVRILNENYDYISQDIGTVSTDRTSFILDTSASKFVDMRVRGNVSASNLLVGRNLNVSANAFIGNTLEVGNDVLVYDGLTVNGNTNLNDSLTVGGTTLFNDSVTATDYVQVNGPLNVSALASFGNHLEVSGNAYIRQDLFVFDNTIAYGQMIVDGRVSLSATLGVRERLNCDGVMTVSGDTTFGRDVYVSRDIIVSDDLFVTDDSFLTGSITVDGPALLNANATVGGNGLVYGAANISGAVSVGGLITANNDVEVAGDVLVDGGGNFQGYLQTQNDMNVVGALYVATNNFEVRDNGDVLAFQRMNVSGTVKVADNLKMDGQNANLEFNALGSGIKTTQLQSILSPSSGGGTDTLIFDCGNRSFGKLDVSTADRTGLAFTVKINTTKAHTDAIIQTQLYGDSLGSSLNGVSIPYFISNGDFFSVKVYRIDSINSIQALSFFIINET